MAAIDWVTVEDAIYDWIVAASGLASTAVVWADQPGIRPEKPFISMMLDDVEAQGHDWRVYDDAPDPEPGAELRVRARGMRTARLQLQCFPADLHGDDSTKTVNSASKTLADVISYLPLAEYDLDLAGIGIGSTAPVKTIQGRRGGILEPQAMVELTIHLASELEARHTYVERVQVFINETSIPVASQVWIPDAPASAFSSGFDSGFE
jgi:hypothetical protein